MATMYDQLKFIQFAGGEIAPHHICWTPIMWRKFSAAMSPEFYNTIGQQPSGKPDKDMMLTNMSLQFRLGLGVLPDLLAKVERVEREDPLVVRVGMDNITDVYRIGRAQQFSLTANADDGMLATCQYGMSLKHDEEIPKGVSDRDVNFTPCRLGKIYTAAWEVPASNVAIVAKSARGTTPAGTAIDVTVPVQDVSSFTGDRCGKSWVFTVESEGGLLDVFLVNDIVVTVPEVAPGESKVVVSVKSDRLPQMFATDISFAQLLERWGEIADISGDIRFGLRTRQDGSAAWEWDEEDE